jgi:uncharacterized protein involved in response to NO
MKSIPLRPVPPAPPAHPASSASASADAPWRFARLLTAPHRLGFFAAAVVLAATGLWWAMALGTRHLGLALPWAVPPPVAHGLAMSMSFLPLFMVGFLLTAGPRWLGLAEVDARTLRVPVGAIVVGWTLALAGFHLQAGVAAAGLALVTAGWAWLVGRFARMVRRSRASDRLHASAVALAGAIGVLSMAMATPALVQGRVDWARAAAMLAIWGFAAPVYAIVSHRMLPFFTASAVPGLEAWRPNGLLFVMLGALALSAAAAMAQVLAVPIPATLQVALAVLQGVFAMAMLWLAWRWGLVQSVRIRLLAMLYGGFVWLGLAMALAAASHLRVALWGEAASLGLAPLHALAIGYLGATLLAMITRVAAGHSGRPLVADDAAWALYLLVQAAAVARVLSSLWERAEVPLVLAAGAAWSVACIGWAWRYGGWLGRPRVDGRPG